MHMIDTHWMTADQCGGSMASRIHLLTEGTVAPIEFVCFHHVYSPILCKSEIRLIRPMLRAHFLWRNRLKQENDVIWANSFVSCDSKWTQNLAIRLPIIRSAKHQQMRNRSGLAEQSIDRSLLRFQSSKDAVHNRYFNRPRIAIAPSTDRRTWIESKFFLCSGCQFETLMIGWACFWPRACFTDMNMTEVIYC